MADPFQPGKTPPPAEGADPTHADDPDYGAMKARVEALKGPMEGFADHILASFKAAGDTGRAKVAALVSAYEGNIGAFFGALYGDPANADIKMVITSRDTWAQVVPKLSDADIAFIFSKLAEDPKLRAIMPERALAEMDSGDFAPDADKLMKLVDALTNPDNPDSAVFLQRAFNEGIDPLAAIGGYHKEDFATAFPEDAALLLETTREAHHKGAMMIAYTANELHGTDFTFADLSPEQRTAVLWTNTAELTELYGSELGATPEQKWEGQVKPFTELVTRLLQVRESDPAVEAQLVALSKRTDIADFDAYRVELDKIISTGSVRLDSPALFKAAMAMEFTKPGEVVADPESHMNGLFYADTQQYPYLTMAFMGEKIGIQRVSVDGGREGTGETSMSLPREIQEDMFARFPWTDKARGIKLQTEGGPEIPISGPSAQYVYINDGTFFDQPDRVYTYKESPDGEDQTVTPREFLDFLREKKAELQG